MCCKECPNNCITVSQLLMDQMRRKHATTQLRQQLSAPQFFFYRTVINFRDAFRKLSFCSTLFSRHHRQPHNTIELFLFSRKHSSDLGREVYQPHVRTTPNSESESKKEQKKPKKNHHHKVFWITIFPRTENTKGRKQNSKSHLNLNVNRKKKIWKLFTTSKAEKRFRIEARSTWILLI